MKAGPLGWGALECPFCWAHWHGMHVQLLRVLQLWSGHASWLSMSCACLMSWCQYSICDHICHGQSSTVSHWKGCLTVT